MHANELSQRSHGYIHGTHLSRVSHGIKLSQSSLTSIVDVLKYHSMTITWKGFKLTIEKQ